MQIKRNQSQISKIKQPQNQRPLLLVPSLLFLSRSEEE